ncbi:interleukin 19 like [Larimichthys crocea]|uniref:interleukin 19 like n=1 Tax=Larimichthys crocea TaxID=215358 RepID=UPI000F5E040E|nr:interleukin-20 [Larimichthys crocea]XP_019112204.2 interleukin-20 [Larimichthys crocea]
MWLRELCNTREKSPSVHYKRSLHGDTEAHLSQDSSSEEHTQTHSSPTRHQEMMKMLLGHSLCLLLLLSRLGELVESRALHLDSCSVNVHTQELRKYYSTMRSNVIAADGEVAVKIVSKSLIKNVQDGQMCCFLRLVLRFYVERVFSNYASAQPQDQRCSSALANAFVSIRKEINKCHCHCAEETQRTVDSLHAEFIRLETNQAAQKAMGELDTVLEWLEGLGQNSLR